MLPAYLTCSGYMLLKWFKNGRILVRHQNYQLRTDIRFSARRSLHGSECEVGLEVWFSGGALGLQV